MVQLECATLVEVVVVGTGTLFHQNCEAVAARSVEHRAAHAWAEVLDCLVGDQT